MTLVLIVLLPFLGGLCSAFLPANARNAEAWLAGGCALACTALTLGLYPEISGNGMVRFVVPWLSQAGLDFHLRMDGFAWLFALLVSLMGTLVVIYARYYLSPEDPVPRFFSFLLAFMGSMLGIVLSGNLIQLVIFWELTSFSSFMLIAYWYHRVDARHGARMALTVTAAGGFCLLVGVIMLGTIAGSYDLDRVLAAAGQVQSHPWYPVMLTLILLGALTKSAQFPFQFWLPHAMAAPTPVSAYLHSATMVKAGVFLLARLWPVLAGTELWFILVSGAGLASLLVGAAAALFQRDMKGVLAYSTVSHLGLITLLLGMNSRLALVAAVFHMMNHATFKASLFMAAGIVDHETGTRDLRRLSGLAHAMPITATVAAVAAAAMAGVPLLNGFLSKEMFFAETIFAGEGPLLRLGLPAVATTAGAFSVAYSLRLIHQVFFGPPERSLPRTPREPTRWMLLPSMLLVTTCLLVGIFPARTIGPVLAPAVVSILGEQAPPYSLSVWHGFTVPFMMSMGAFAGGIGIYLLHWFFGQRATGGAPLRAPLDGRRVFDIIIVVLHRFAERMVRFASSRRLQLQLLIMVSMTFVVAGIPIASRGMPRGAGVLTPVDPAYLFVWAIGCVCAVGAALKAKFHRLAALIMLGGSGLFTSLSFAWFSAPDLALTQVAVEVVTLVLLLLGLRWLPRRVEADEPDHRSVRARLRRTRDFLVAGAVGGGLAALSFVVLTQAPVDGISRFFVERALPEGGGHNIVNVILVDFRGFDTLGEITVVSIVALTVYALLRRFRPAPESIRVPRAQRVAEDTGGLRNFDPGELLPGGDPRIPAVLVRLLLPMAGLVAVYLLLRGHDAPGGGFVGGLVMAIAFITQYMVGGALWVEWRMRVHPQYWVALGLTAAGGAGLLAVAMGRHFLASLGGEIALPLAGPVRIGSVLLFDAGVYLVVIGATSLILIALAHQSFRSARDPAGSGGAAG
ncbi:MAG: monovalent cation/H+ antiporter subunit A [Proteobacteria bacterium]|nr:MAG: monovalent cation/H+ antiporter subunit A [Pseudomonadota bacterium]MBC6944360.1 monovalent cation/H+ antiporter subunit A [Gammaproteobacteria bacterium]MCE7895360.1 monovalent cation/H+ antiporter subunit A [Gammaproteobacteria bacterium PRO8]MDL1881304.1 monovalent cation/H+ antiporter subunit A [Gammaproteobacteria bacterium PRO2]MCL4777779.1 monovalent cation/H+ antiporter subunit A [Gammaproteobacteria bacterium]